MGMRLFGSIGCTPDTYGSSNRVKGDPDPTRFMVVLHKSKEIGDYILLWVNYPDCTNYEGNKILILKLRDYMQMESGFLDPHFLEDSFSPLARFKPNEEGYKMAEELLEYLKGKK